MNRRFVAFALAGAAALVMAGSAFAKPPVHSTATPTLSINQPAALGASVNFTYSAPGIKDPRIAVRCYQNGVMTYAAADTADAWFVLGGGWSQWVANGGPADCTGELFYFTGGNGNTPQTEVTLAWTSFPATG